MKERRALRRIGNSLRRLAAAMTGDPELAQAQHRVVARQIPLLYFILSLNTLSIVYVFAGAGPHWLSLYMPLGLTAVCVLRGLVWWRRGDQEATTETALAVLRVTTRFAIALAGLFSLWGMALYGYGDVYARAQVLFFLGLTMCACAICLSHLLPAALWVAAIGVGPYCIFFFVDEGRFHAVAVNLALVSVGLVAMLVRNYGQFARLIASQRALVSQHAESLRLADENSRLANLDALTGLPNRRLFVARLGELCGDPAAGPVAVAFIDLDGFKNINDDYGHDVGDQLIVGVARALADRAPAGALLARLGGDEFALVASGAAAEAEVFEFGVAARMALTQSAPIGGRAVGVGASVGVAVAPAGRCEAHELMRRADVAMYRVKANGKGGVQRYEPGLDGDRRRVAALGDEIRAGLAAGEFEVHYQPVVDAQSKRIISVEALLRWPRRPHGPLAPDVFIPAAETVGLVEALGLFALRRACEDLRGVEGVGLSVNLSPMQLRSAEFAAEVGAILAATGFPPQRLSFEVTDGYLVDDPERAAAAIGALRKMGASVVLDDFGSGYASIPYLERYGFSAIKIDRMIASRIGVDERARLLITGIVFVANGFDMQVTAAGVETEEQAQLLRLAGCQNLQGFRYSRPKPIRELLLETQGAGADLLRWR